MRDLNKFKGCLIGGAVGDALGYAVEFLPAASIFKKYGENGIIEYELHHEIAEISDNTQMTLFTATELLVGTTRGMTRGIMGDYAEYYIAYSYRDWYQTQTEQYPLPEEFHYSWLVNIPEMFSRRAPGNTCLSALAQGGNGTMENLLNQSKGCGGCSAKAVMNTGREDKKLSKNIKAVMLGIAAKLGKIIPMDKYKNSRLESTLKSAGIKMTPETFTALSFVKALSVALSAVPCAFFMPLLIPFFIILAVSNLLPAY